MNKDTKGGTVKKKSTKKTLSHKKAPLDKNSPSKRNHFRSNIVKSFKRLNLSEILKKAIPYIIFGYFGNKFTYAFRLTPEKNFAMRLVKSLGRFGQAFENLMPSFNGYDLLGGVITGVALWLIVYLKKKNAKKFRHGLEYSSARWGSRKDIIPYMDEDDPDNNMIITKTESVRLNGRPKSIEYAVNKNVMVIGGSGSGKTRFFVKPQIMQLHSSYIISDPKGQVLIETGKMLQQAGYVIKVIDTTDFDSSMHYNPFAYLRSEKDIMKLITILMANTTGEKQASSDPFWENAERLVYMAYIGYIYYECIEEEQNFGTLVDMINASETREDDEDFKNAIDLIFEELEQDEPNHFAVRQYRNNNYEENESYYLGHIDFTSFHRYLITSSGIDVVFFRSLLGKIISDDEKNVIYKAYSEGCSGCQKKDNCPVYWNYKELTKNKELREHIITVLTKAIIKGNLAPSVRELNDFFYEIIIGRTFDENSITARTVDRLTHFIKNTTLWLLYENSEGLLQYTAKEDILGDSRRKCDKQLISLNLKPDFELWIQETAMKVSPIYSQIFNDILFCKNSNARKYKEAEQDIRQAVFKLYIRFINLSTNDLDERYNNYINYLYYYNAGLEDKCKDVIQLAEECIYLWNGRLGDKSGTNVRNGVIVNRASSKFYLFKKMDVRFAKNQEIVPLNDNGTLPNFSSTLHFGFKLKDGNTIIPLDIDYELYSFLLEIKSGFVPTNSDRKKNVKYDAFVRKMIAESDSDTYVYSRNNEGKTYRISKDDFDNYTFGLEV